EGLTGGGIEVARDVPPLVTKGGMGAVIARKFEGARRRDELEPARQRARAQGGEAVGVDLGGGGLGCAVGSPTARRSARAIGVLRARRLRGSVGGRLAGRRLAGCHAG